MLDKLNQNGRFGMGIAVAAVAVAVILVTYQLQGRTNGASAAASHAFYTDDGKSFFKDDINKVVPFDHNGKQAYRCDVFQDAAGKQFVGLVYRYTDSGKHEIENYIAKKVSDPDGIGRQNIDHRAMQVKLASSDDKAWTLADDTAIDRLQASVQASHDGKADLVKP